MIKFALLVFAVVVFVLLAGNWMMIFGGCGGCTDPWVLANANGLGGTPTWTQLSPSDGPPLATGAGAFNATSLPQTGIQGRALIDLPVEDFQRPVAAYTTANFVTARAAGRRMSPLTSRLAW